MPLVQAHPLVNIPGPTPLYAKFKPCKQSASIKLFSAMKSGYGMSQKSLHTFLSYLYCCVKEAWSGTVNMVKVGLVIWFHVQPLGNPGPWIFYQKVAKNMMPTCGAKTVIGSLQCICLHRKRTSKLNFLLFKNA